MKKHQGKISILIVPEEEGQPRSIKLSGTLVTVLKIAGIVLLGALIAGMVSYFLLWKKNLNFDRLYAENHRLREDNLRVQQLTEDVERLKELDRRIRKALGVDFTKDSLDYSVIQETPISALKTQGEFFSDYTPVFLKPIDGLVSRGFTEESFPGTAHIGVDIAAASGTLVSAASDGWVIFNGQHSRYGNFLIVQHPGDYLTFYGHLSNSLVRPGDKVSAGSPIALSGNSGRSTAPHLHFEIRLRGKYLDPAKFIVDYKTE